MASAMAVRMTADEFLRSDHKGFELICGEPVEKLMGALSSWTGGEAYWHVRNHLGGHPVGRLFNSEAGYSLWPDRPLEVRKPDVSVVRNGRLPGNVIPLGWIPFAPDLAVEVVSKNDDGPDIERKIAEYLSAGVRLLWVIYPETRTAYAYRPDGSVTRIDENGVLSGEDVLPGFELRLGLILPAVSEVETR